MALLNQYKDLNSEDKDTQTIQINLKQYFQQFTDLTFLKGRAVNDIEVTTSTVVVDHKLGRQPIGWFIVDKSASGDVWRTAWNDKTITLDSSATTTINIWIY